MSTGFVLELDQGCTSGGAREWFWSKIVTPRTDGAGGERTRFVHGKALMPLLGFFSVRDNPNGDGQTIHKIGSPDVHVKENGRTVTVWRTGTEVALRWRWGDAGRLGSMTDLSARLVDEAGEFLQQTQVSTAGEHNVAVRWASPGELRHVQAAFRTARLEVWPTVRHPEVRPECGEYVQDGEMNGLPLFRKSTAVPEVPEEVHYYVVYAWTGSDDDERTQYTWTIWRVPRRLGLPYRYLMKDMTCVDNRSIGWHVFQPRVWETRTSVHMLPTAALRAGNTTGRWMMACTLRGGFLKLPLRHAEANATGRPVWRDGLRVLRSLALVLLRLSVQQRSLPPLPKEIWEDAVLSFVHVNDLGPPLPQVPLTPYLSTLIASSAGQFGVREQKGWFRYRDTDAVRAHLALRFPTLDPESDTQGYRRT